METDRRGNVWLAPSKTAPSLLYRVTADGSLIAHPLPMLMTIRSFQWADDDSLLVQSFQATFVRIDARGRTHAYPDYRAGFVSDVAFDAEARPWYAVPDLEAIRRFDASGPRGVYHLGVRPQTLLFDRSGELWFLYPRGIGEITTRGEIRIHPSHAETDMIGHFMSLSPSGDIWVAGRCDEVVRIARDHHIDHIPLPEFHDCPKSIVPGLHDDAWFVAYAPIIGHVFADGRVNFYQVPGPQPGALNIALDRNGDVWFTDAFNDAYGELMPQNDSGRLSPPP